MATRGRPRLQTDSERKRRKTQRDQSIGHSRISIGECIDEWKHIKEENSFKKARLLIERLVPGLRQFRLIIYSPTLFI